MSKVYFGIDIGTSSSSISYIVESPRNNGSAFIEPVAVPFSFKAGSELFRNQCRLPSILSVEQKGTTQKILTGATALEAAAGRRAKPFENLFMSSKTDLGSLKVYEDSVHPDLISPADVSAEIIKALLNAAEKETGIDPRKADVVITVPASFSHAQRQDTIGAALKAGLTIGEGDLLDEPIAAFIHTACHQKLDAQLDMKTAKNVLMFDLGAGTCDVSIFTVRYQEILDESDIGLSVTNRAISNYEKLGGDNIDLHIVENELLTKLNEDGDVTFDLLPERIKREIRFKLKVRARMIKEEICEQMSRSWGKKVIKQNWSIDQIPIPSLNMKTHKVTGSTNTERFMELMHPFVMDDLTKSFKVVDDYFTFSFFGPVLGALDKAGIDPEDIHAFVFNGGSCHNPVIRKAFETHDLFYRTKFFDTPDLDLSVVKGAAIHCYHLHKHKRSIVTPIVNSEIGIFTLGLKREQLVEAGLTLPFPPDGKPLISEGFLVPKDGIENLGISIYSGDGCVINNLKLPLPIGVKKGEPICIGLSIDANKVMKFSAYMKKSPGVKMEAELSNPWSHRINSPEDIKANELWEKVSGLKKNRQSVSATTMVDLANLERKRRNISGALEILQRLEDKGTDSEDFHNILALCYWAKGAEQKALNHFRRAYELAPKNAFYATNYASQLLDMGSVEEAISMLRDTAAKSPDEYQPYYWLGIAFKRKGELEQAKREYLRAQKILRDLCASYPESEWYLNTLAEVSSYLGEYEEADRIRKQVNNLRNDRLLGGNREILIAGPKSGLWKEDEIFENEEENS